MQSYLNINTLIAVQPSMSAPATPQPSFIYNAGSEQRFDAILNEKLNDITNQKNIKISDENRANDIAQQESSEHGSKFESRKFNEVDIEERINTYSDNKEDINAIRKDDAGNYNENIKTINDIDETEENSNLKITERKSVIDNLSLLLDNLNLLIDIIKNASLDKKQTNELKSILSELRNTLGLKDIQNDTLNKSNLSAMDGVLVKKLLDRLKSLVDVANERAGVRNHIFDRNQLKDQNLRDNKSDTLEIANLKKQISKLAEDIRQHLIGRKAEIGSAKIEDPFIESKNSNQKIFAQNQSIEKTEISQGKENASGFNYSFSRKETETAGLQQKGNTGFAERKGLFDEQLKTIVQNAKIVVRDSKNGSFSIRLHPESLGRININLNLEQGVIVGKFLVDSFNAKEALLENMSAVRDNLLENGISVGEFQVNVRGENKSFSDTSEDIPFNHPNRIFPGFAGIEYESNSYYLHDGQIDLII